MELGDKYVREIKRRIGELRSRAIDHEGIQEAYREAAYSVLLTIAPGSETLVNMDAEVRKLALADSSILVDINLGNGLRVTGSTPIPLPPDARELTRKIDAAEGTAKKAKEICQELAFHHDLLSAGYVLDFHRYVTSRKGSIRHLAPKDIVSLVADFIESEREYECPYEKE